MEKAIAAGDIAWHALPFTWQTELMDATMISGGVGLSRDLDRRFGKSTTGAKMSDVPGHTRGLIAPLAAQGVKLLDIGVNEASTVPDVPPLFVWKAPGGSSLVVMYHHSYGGVVRVPESDLAVAIVVRDDNSGPHTVDEIHQTYTTLKSRFPNARITPTSLSEIANAVDPHRGSLPVLTSEIGDTWIHGVASDPLKLARYREVARLRQGWLSSRKFAAGDATDIALLRHLLLEVEHTWGTDTKTWLDFDHYTPSDLAPMLETKNYKVVQFSWQEKREDLFAGIATLPSPLRERGRDGSDAISRQSSLGCCIPALTRLGKRSRPAHLSSGLIQRTEPSVDCVIRSQKREWASSENPLALFSYQTLSQQDYSRFFASYVVSDRRLGQEGFRKAEH